MTGDEVVPRARSPYARPCPNSSPYSALPAATACAADLPLERIKLPPGFAIEVYAEVPGARSLALGEKGIVYVGTQRSGAVTALLPGPGGKPEVIRIASGLNVPNGVAFRNGALYVGEISRILRFDGITARLRDPPDPVVVTDRFPTREPPRLEVHRLRTRRQAVRAGGRALQHLRARSRALRTDLPDQPGRHRLRSLRARRAQHRRLRLGPAHRGDCGSTSTAAT